MTISEIINCPSGLSRRIRGMKVREERVLADRKLAKNGGQVGELLGACWEETLDPGPYDFGNKVIDWGQVLQGDRFFALLQIRALTYGPEYAFAVNCGSDGCRARIEWENAVKCARLPWRTARGGDADAGRAGPGGKGAGSRSGSRPADLPLAGMGLCGH